MSDTLKIAINTPDCPLRIIEVDVHHRFTWEGFEICVTRSQNTSAPGAWVATESQTGMRFGRFLDDPNNVEQEARGMLQSRGKAALEKAIAESKAKLERLRIEAQEPA